MKQETVSIIIPVYQEAERIDGLLEQLDRLPGRWEAIFADGGSTDDTAERIRGRYPVIHAPRGRARQMNAAAAQAGGDVLLFLHADSILPRDLCRQIREVRSRGYSFGCFRLRFESRHPVMKLGGFFSNLRVKFFGIAFGDQGIFLTRELFDEIGGFPDLPLMEDYQLSLSLRGRAPLGQAGGYLTTSARRFESGGMFRTMWAMKRLQRRFRRGDPIEEIARAYRNIR